MILSRGKRTLVRNAPSLTDIVWALRILKDNICTVGRKQLLDLSLDVLQIWERSSFLPLEDCFSGLLLVRDTFPGGCAFDESIVHHKYLKENPDDHNPAYNTKYGVYSEGCGLENVMMSWGHDDYMYLVAKEKKTTLPAAGLSVIIYHSLLCTSLLSSTGESWSSEVCRSSSTQLGLSLLEGQGMM
ncbi:Inositol oxygenase 1 [Vitis vinifera]|uniref:Inositol oxygenase n=1 Tax=Vitis vinifera TaxID=29760 RepID=A0A438EW14_VITVI|nr:Inositol oxygenase 1 [Vitis vinifera]